jgi:chorismate mutase
MNSLKLKLLIWRIERLDKMIAKLEEKRWKLAKKLESEKIEDMFNVK